MKKLINVFQFVIAMWISFVAVDAYCHWHFDVISPVELYQIDKERYEHNNPGEIGYMSFYEWQIDQDGKDKAIWNEVTLQITESFDPWFDRQTPADEVREHGQD